MIHLTIDGQSLTVPKGTTVYHAAQQLAIDVPIFCYHDRMPPFGACRVCLVEVEKMGKLQTSCTLEATEGMNVNTQSQMAIEGRQGILELLLINHPLDCPICDRGGECPLQDQTLKFGPGKSQFFEEKRHFKKPLPLGPVLMLDRERCITCARCTRFGDLIAGDHALEFIERGYKTEVGTPDGGPAASKFIGNTIMICPVGALTSEVYRFRARPWDNDSTNSTCTLCPVGCSLTLDSRDGEIMRTRSCTNREVNDVWLCDKGWFGYEFAEHPDRLKKPLIRRSGILEPCNWEEALSLVAAKIKEAKPKGKLAGLGGNPLTVEENYLFQKLMREGAGVNHVDHRVGPDIPLLSLDEEGLAPGMEITIGECEELSFAILCGIDLTEEFPVIWLRLKQAINRGAVVIFLGHFAPEIAPHLTETILHAPGDELDILAQNMPRLQELASSGKKGALFVGRQYLTNPHRKAILSKLAPLRQARVSLNILEGRGNSTGARLAGMRPDLGPFGERLSTPGLNTIQILESAARDGWDFLYVAGANPAACIASELWLAARAKLNFLVVQDLFLTTTAQQADLVLPSLCFIEKEGSFLNIEGRVQKLLPGKEIPNSSYSDASIFTRIARKLQINLTPYPHHLKNMTGRKQNTIVSDQNPEGKKWEDKNLLATFSHPLFDHGVRMQHNSHVVQLAKEPRARLHPLEGEKRGIQDGEQVLLSAHHQSIPATIKWDRGVAAGTIVLPLGFDEMPVHNLGNDLFNGLPITIRKIKS